MSILSERRAFMPYGMAGGEPGQRGLNLVRFAADNRTISLGGKNTICVQPGDRLLIHSPGGGGYGAPAVDSDAAAAAQAVATAAAAAASAEVDTASVPMRTSGSLLQYSMNQESV